jgi:hypothetical protein
MKKFSDMEINEVIDVINDSKELRDMLDQYIQETECDWLGDLLHCFKSGAVDYSIGFFDHNYFTVKDNDLFLEGVCKSHDSYGLTVKGEKLLHLCEKLQGTNLFGYWCGKLAEQYYKDELKSMVDYVEDASYELYCGSVGEKSMNYVDCFVDNVIGNYLYDEECETYYEPHKISA